MGASILEYVDFLRLDASRRKSEKAKAELEQYFSSASLARLMASMFEYNNGTIRILDPGAGVGSLFSACIEEILKREKLPDQISVTTYEIDESLSSYIKDVFEVCEKSCNEKGVRFNAQLVEKDFIHDSAEKIGGLFSADSTRYNCIIMNPPYGKINVDSKIHRMLKSIGLETTNYYAAFVSLAECFLEEDGEMVSITPRSFCNGPYFKNFRKRFLRSMRVRRIHVFNSRTISFSDDEVLQENVILYAIKNKVESSSVIISSSDGPEDECSMLREVNQSLVVSPDDPESFIRIVTDEMQQHIANRMESLPNTLSDLGLEVSTGKVVDFRALDYLSDKPLPNTVPLIHPANLRDGFVKWPINDSRKPGYFKATHSSNSQLVPRGNYVLTKRFSTKEEKKRIVAAIYDSEKITSPMVGFENRVNYYHTKGEGLDMLLAKGLALFLNSTFVDSYFRQFNGHTQVNATDLRNIHYPSIEQLRSLGKHISRQFPNQDSLDAIVQEELFSMSQNNNVNPVAAKKKIDEAISILKMLDMPRQQQNERSALTLLSLLDLKPDDPWLKASNPKKGIRPTMDFFAEFYGKKYAENTRESVRRQTMHQFIDAGFVLHNPDDPKRPINSDKNNYQIEPSALELFRLFGTPEWDKALQTFKLSVPSLTEKYAEYRNIQRIPLEVKEGKTITISPGGQNELIEKIVQEFGPRFANGGTIIYIGDTDNKEAYLDEDCFKELGIMLDRHGKAPDVMIWDMKRNWLFLIEAVTSHGPVNYRRKEQLTKIFGKSKSGLVFVTAFMNKRAMVKHLPDISWETDVWVADSPDHMIHFNGERFMGPYNSNR